MIGPNSVTFHSKHPQDFAFLSLAECKREKFSLIKKVVNDVLAPIYGDLQTLLSDIEDRKERKTEILTHCGRDVGCIVYKRDLIKNSASEDSLNCLEISLVALFDPVGDDSKGYRTKLVERIEEVAKEFRASGISYTLPTNLYDHIKYFEHKRFQKIPLLQSGNIQECLLVKKIEQKRRKIEEPQPAPAKQKHELSLKDQYIVPIHTGRKTVEGRINSGAPSKYKAGDLLHLFNNRSSVTVTIAKIEQFASFREMLEATGFEKCIPEARNLEAAVKVYSDIPNYDLRAKQNGVLAIHLADPK